MARIARRCTSLMGGATSAWADLMALARSKANIVDLGQGYPDFEGSRLARVKASESLLTIPMHNQYSTIGGLRMLHESIRDFYLRKYGCALDPAKEVVCTSGGTEGLYCMMQALVNPGDKVLMFEPFFPWYLPDVKLAGMLHVRTNLACKREGTGDGTWSVIGCLRRGKSAAPGIELAPKGVRLQFRAFRVPARGVACMLDVSSPPLRTITIVVRQRANLLGGEPLIVPLKPPAFGFDEEALRKAFQQKPRVVIVNTPHNPTGRVFSKADLDLIAKQCMEHDVIAISDEAYENITFDGHPHLRLADVKGMGVRTLTMGTSSKLLSLTGWRVGWVTGPEEYIGAIKMMHSYISFCPPTPLQVGVAHALNGLCAGSEGERENERISLLMEDNAKKLGAALGALGGVEVYPPQGGYFLVCDVGETGMDDLGFCRWLIEKVNINAVPMSIFYSDTAGPCTLVRFAICKESGTIEKAVDALGDHVDSWKSKRAVL